MLKLSEDFNTVLPYGNIVSLTVDESFQIVHKHGNGFRVSMNSHEDRDRNKEDIPSTFDTIYKYNGSWWACKGNWNVFDMKDESISSLYPEIKRYHDEIISYINNIDMKNMREKLTLPKRVSIGLVSKPGMGKTTLIRMICSTLNIDIAIVENGIEYDFDSLYAVLVVEDYDRFNVETRESLRSSLNELIYTNNENIPIIFYTSNTKLDCHELDMVFEFESHTYDTYSRSVSLLFPDNVNEITELLLSKDISMREANNLLCAAYCSGVKPKQYIEDNVGKIAQSTLCKYSNRVNYDSESDWY